MLILAGGLLSAIVASQGQESRPASSSAPASRPELMAQALEELDQGRYPKALELLVSIRPAYKDDAGYYLALGRAYLGTREYAIAIGAFKAAIERRKDLLEAYLRLAICYGCTGRSKEAVDELEKAAKIDPSDARLFYATGLVRAMLKQWEQAEASMKTAAELGGPFMELTKKKIEAIVSYQQAENREIKKRRDAINLAKQDHDQAAQILQETKDGLIKANSDRKDAEKKYKEDRQEVVKAYNEVYQKIMERYEKDKPPESMKDTDPFEYRRRIGDATATMTASLMEAGRIRDKAFADIDKAYKPIVDTIDATIKLLQKKGPEDVTREAQTARKLAQLETEDKNYVSKPPFDLAVALRDIPVDMARRPSSQSAATQTQASLEIVIPTSIPEGT